MGDNEAILKAMGSSLLGECQWARWSFWATVALIVVLCCATPVAACSISSSPESNLVRPMPRRLEPQVMPSQPSPARAWNEESPNTIQAMRDSAMRYGYAQL
jgi:hypothetical protein